VLNVAEHHMLSGCPFSYCFQIMEFANFDPFSFSFAYRLMNIWLDEMMEENMDQAVQKAEAPLQMGKGNRRREDAPVGETARDYGRPTIQIWTMKMTTNSSRL